MRFLSNPFLNAYILQKRDIFRVQMLKFWHGSIAGYANASEEAETICRLLSKIGYSANLDTVLDSSNLGDSLSPDLALQVLKKLNNAGTIALSFFRWAENKKGFQHSPQTYNSLIESLGKIRQFKTVWLLVDEMKAKGLLSKDTFALVSRRLARARRVKEAIEAFKKMENKYGMKPELQDFNRLLDTLSKSRHVESAQEVFDEMRKSKFTPDVISYTILLEGWGQECNFLRLDEVYRDMKDDGFEPDVVSYGILINAYCKAKRHDQAVKLFHEMETKNIKGTPHVFCTLINGLGSEKKLNEAIGFFELCQSSGCEIDTPTYNALVGAYCWSSRIEDAYKVLNEMRKHGTGPDARTYDIILHHLIKAQRTAEAYTVFKKMGCEATASTYEIMLRMFCSKGRPDMALRVWDQMKMKGVVPGMHMFCGLINGLCNGGDVDGACRYVEEMLGLGMRPPDRLFKNLKKFLIKEGREDVVIVFARKIEVLRNTPLANKEHGNG